MLGRLHWLLGKQVHGQDGELGQVVDLYLNSRRWSVRYLILDCGGRMDRDEVLVGSADVTAEPEAPRLRSTLTRREVALSPAIDAVLPVAQAREIELSEEVGPRQGWLPGLNDLNIESPFPVSHDLSKRAEAARAGGHLRSYNEILGYRLHAGGEDAGEVEDVVCDLRDWSLRYIVASVRPVLRKKSVLLDVDQVTGIHWDEQRVEVSASQDQLETGPEIDADTVLGRATEEQSPPHQ